MVTSTTVHYALIEYNTTQLYLKFSKMKRRLALLSVMNEPSGRLECYVPAVCLVGDYRREDRVLNTVENTLKSTARVLHGLRGR